MLMRSAPGTITRGFPGRVGIALAIAAACLPASRSSVSASGNPAAARFRKDVLPVLTEYCFDCHGDGMNKGQVAFDAFQSEAELVGKRDLWLAVLKNTRAGLMPPEKKPHPPAVDFQKLEHWIKQDAFGIDPADPDPGRVTLRRLNRTEYRNTIRDLMGFDFKADDEFPPDDTGYGFDNIGDVLTVSPLLLEKYMQAAETIVAGAVPTVARTVQEKTIPGSAIRDPDGGFSGERLSFYKPARLSHTHRADQAGDYRILVEVEISGQFDFDPGRCNLVIQSDGRELASREFGWQNNKRFHLEFDQKWQPGDHPVSFELQPLTPADQKVNSLDLKILSLKIQGPLDPRLWARTRNHDRFFPREQAPDGKAERRRYAREVLGAFATRAFRRPVDPGTVDRLAGIAEAVYSRPGKKFEEGIGQAMVAVLSSPRFLFRVEENEAADRSRAHPLVDEFSLASRLSYFLWSTMPDAALFALAERHQLRRNLEAQVRRMLADPRSSELIDNFTGQWLQVRDVDGIDINSRAVLGREKGEEKEIQAARRRLQELQAKSELNPDEEKERDRLIEERRRRFSRPTIELDGPLRRAMRQETQLFFGRILREDRSVMEMIDSDYTYLNERLAKHYGIPGVQGNDMRLVQVPADCPRGGLLTQASFLVVTSNPTRTSPVKRGLFVLDNILGAPTAPPPPDVPLLDEAEKQFKDHEPSLREALEAHRNKPLCNSCHSRMDPLGLALENFNALGMFRDQERGQPIDPAGRLITGESFHDIRELKQVLKTRHRPDFYRCLTEKLLTYALGRGLEYYDVESVDRIVARLDRDDGRFSALLMGVIDSAPFQKRRAQPVVTETAPAPRDRLEAKRQP